MIQSASFQNFKGLRDVRIDFEPFTVLVGPNASGKSSVLQGLQYITRLRHEAPQELLKGEIHPSWLVGRTAQNMQIEVRLDGWEVQVRIGVQSAPGNGLNASASTRPVTLDAAMMRPVQSDPDWLHLDNRAVGVIPVTVLLRLDPERLSEPSCGAEAIPRIRPDGAGLSSALAYLLLNQPARFRSLTDMLHRHFPFVRDLRFERVLVSGNRWGEQLLLDQDGAPGLPAQLASDGTLFVLGLLTALFGADQPTLVLLDDIDRGLHPQAQRELVRLLRQIQQDKPDLQIIATTHSPYLLDEMRPEEVRLTTRLDDGSVACGRLDAHPEFERWKEAMAPGEFWSMVGEEWVARRKPQVAAR